MVKLAEVKKKAVPEARDDDGDDDTEEVRGEYGGDPSGTRVSVTRTALGEVDDTVNIVYYGDGGGGKTTHLAAMARLGKVVIINAESGLKASALRRQGVPVENIEVVPDPDSGQALSYEVLDSLFWELKADLESGRSAYVGTSWDSMTEIVKVVTNAATAERVAKARRTGKGSTDPFFTDLADYGRMTDQLRPLIRRYRDLPIHFGASALERRYVDDDGRVTYQPAMTPALRDDLFGYVDIVCHVEVQEDPEGGTDDLYFGTFRPVGKYRAKDRFGALPKKLINPTFDRVLAYVNGDLVESDDDEQQAARKRINDYLETKAQATPEDE